MRGTKCGPTTRHESAKLRKFLAEKPQTDLIGLVAATCVRMCVCVRVCGVRVCVYACLCIVSASVRVRVGGLGTGLVVVLVAAPDPLELVRRAPVRVRPDLPPRAHLPTRPRPVPQSVPQSVPH